MPNNTDSWWPLLSPEAQTAASELFQKTNALRDQGHTIYPERKNVFRALRETPPSKVRAVIIGQDPYHGPGQAEGLCFSVAPGIKPPPSLENIFKEYEADLGYPHPKTGSLAPWAKEGVLLLNTSLTVEAKSPASHSKLGWQTLTQDVLRAAYELPQPVIFIAWGAHAKGIAQGFPPNKTKKKALIQSSHPSPYSASYGFLGSRPFSKTNKLLQEMGGQVINWRLP